MQGNNGAGPEGPGRDDGRRAGPQGRANPGQTGGFSDSNRKGNEWDWFKPYKGNPYLDPPLPDNTPIRRPKDDGWASAAYGMNAAGELNSRGANGGNLGATRGRGRNGRLKFFDSGRR
jgi:hypothetical protein